MKAEEYFGDWIDVIDKQELRKVVTWINKTNSATLCPSPKNIFRAFRACPYEDCKVVFLGQDPYPQKGVATGILFGNSEDTPEDRLSPSLQVVKEAAITNGGFYWKRKSNGERQLQNLGKWVQENQDNWNEKCLLILDEADKGFDLRYQVGLHNMLINIPAKSNVKFLVVSHTLIPILLEDKVYAFQYRRMLSPSTYIFVETGYDIKIDKDERTEV